LLDKKAGDLSQIYGPQYVAGLGQLTQDAISAAGGLGAYQPYLQTAATQAGHYNTWDQLHISSLCLHINKMLLSSTLQEYDIQAQKGLPATSCNKLLMQEHYGGGREGVQRAEYQATSDRNRAALQAQLLQQGFGQAQQAAQTAFGQQQNLATQQQNLAQLAPQLAAGQIAALTTLGGVQQAQTQAGLSAQQQLAQQQFQQPLQAAQQYGSGIMGLISGYPGGMQSQQVPVPGIAQTAIGAGATLAGIYGGLNKGFS
jgi:hypothetical protein